MQQVVVTVIVVVSSISHILLFTMAAFCYSFSYSYFYRRHCNVTGKQPTKKFLHIFLLTYVKWAKGGLGGG